MGFGVLLTGGYELVITMGFGVSHEPSAKLVTFLTPLPYALKNGTARYQPDEVPFHFDNTSILLISSPL